MKQVDRSELLALGAYEQIRDRFRQRVIELKKRRRIALGPHMSLIFENHDTVLLQIQEMLRTERISDERAIAHELETYNELIAARRRGVRHVVHRVRRCGGTAHDARALRQLARSDALRARRDEGHGALRDAFRRGNGAPAGRQYVSFVLGRERAAALRDASVPAALEVSHLDYRQHVELPPDLRAELASDLVD